MMRDDTVGRPVGHRDGEFHHRHSHAGASRHPGGSHLLFVDGLSVSFDLYDPDAPYFSAPRRRVEVLRDLTLSVHAGEVLAVVGASGSGKTVLMKCIAGLARPDSGEVLVDGRHIGTELENPPDMGAIIEVPGFLPNASGYKNLKYLADISGRAGDKEIRAAMEKL